MARMSPSFVESTMALRADLATNLAITRKFYKVCESRIAYRIFVLHCRIDRCGISSAGAHIRASKIPSTWMQLSSYAKH